MTTKRTLYTFKRINDPACTDQRQITYTTRKIDGCWIVEMIGQDINEWKRADLPDTIKPMMKTQPAGIRWFATEQDAAQALKVRTDELLTKGLHWLSVQDMPPSVQHAKKGSK